MPPILKILVDLVIPPRKSERLVRALTEEALERLRQSDGALPYHLPQTGALVWELKYYANPRALALAGALIAGDLFAVASEELGKPLLVPVPMHAARRRERGHNQTEALCKAALAHLGADASAFEYAPHALRRVRQTPPQQGLERRRRLKNVKGSMEAAGVAGRVCIVVDDVTTTGATLTEAKRALRKAGARTVHCVALARS